MKQRDEALIARMDMAEHARAFTARARAHFTGDAAKDRHLELKLAHSWNVFRYACAIAEAEAFFAASPALSRALAAAGLYHDLGRFEQYARYGTFSDAESENHGRLSMREAKRHKLLEGEEPRVRTLVLTAVLLHNRFNVPENMDADALAVAKALRDADKLDIMRIMAEQLTGPLPVDSVVALGAKEGSGASPSILEAVLARRLGKYEDIATVTDFKVLVCGWLYDLNYAFSRKTAVAEGRLCALLESLPQTRELAAFSEQYAADLETYAAL